LFVDGIHDHGVNGDLVTDGQGSFDRVGQDAVPMSGAPG
jgi:hypothetical protein